MTSETGLWTVHGSRIAITGATSGIGRATAIQLAGLGAEIVIMGRSRSRAQEVKAEIGRAGGVSEIVLVDLSSLTSIEEAAAAVSAGGPLSVLINNADVAGRGITADGVELVLGVNLLGAFHLTGLLLPALAASPVRPRVVNVSSNAHLGASLPDLDHLRRRTKSRGVKEYKASKLAMVAWSQTLRRRHPELDVFCVHPGMVATPIWNVAPPPVRWYLARKMLTPDEGARTQVRCAADPGLVRSQVLYWAREAPAEPDPRSLEESVGRSIWEWCERTISEVSGTRPAGAPSDE